MLDIKEQFNLVAGEYDENRRRFIPCFDEYYRDTTDFIAKSLASAPSLIYDLGSGTGLLPSFWYEYFPDSQYVLIDIADEMLDVARKRFKGITNVRYEVTDYSSSLPEGNPDVIMSALSIHHLEDPDKKKLFSDIYSSLREGGVFVNYDQFCHEDKMTDSLVENYWIRQIKESGISQKEYGLWLERKKLDRETTVSRELQWLKEAGFKSAECIYSSGKFAVVFAMK